MFKSYKVDLQSRSQSQPFFSQQLLTNKVLNSSKQSKEADNPFKIPISTPNYSLRQYFDQRNSDNTLSQVQQKSINLIQQIPSTKDYTIFNKQNSYSFKHPSIDQDLQSQSTKNILKNTPLFPLNRHFTCHEEKFKLSRVEQAQNEIDLIDPVLVRNTKELKSRPSMPKSAKYRIIHSFDKVCKKFFASTPMDVEFDLLDKKYEQKKRDIVHQGKYFGQPVSSGHFSRSLQRSWRLLTTNLTMKDLFDVELNKEDINTIFKKQPKGLVDTINIDHFIKDQNSDINDEINFQRKRSLVETIFADKQFCVKDREILYHVLIYQTELAIIQQERVDRVAQRINGLQSQHNNRSKHIENLRSTIIYIMDNYAHLVRRE